MQRAAGFTLIEVVLGALTLLVAGGAILGAYLGQLTLNEHARNLSLAVHDANRMIEQIRTNNVGCTVPAAIPPVTNPALNPVTWDNWLSQPSNQGGGGGRSPGMVELIVVTCQDRDGNNYCGRGGTTPQVAQEWSTVAGTTTYDPIRITVSVCWRHRGRTLGECSWNGAVLTPNDALPIANDTAGVIDSPAMLTTLATCRG